MKKCHVQSQHLVDPTKRYEVLHLDHFNMGIEALDYTQPRQYI